MIDSVCAAESDKDPGGPLALAVRMLTGEHGEWAQWSCGNRSQAAVGGVWGGI